MCPALVLGATVRAAPSWCLRPSHMLSGGPSRRRMADERREPEQQEVEKGVPEISEEKRGETQRNIQILRSEKAGKSNPCSNSVE